LKRRSFLIGAPLALAACGGPPEVWSPDADLARVRYVHDGPPALTLVSMLNVGSNHGAHSALLINADERVLWDPAGSFHHPAIPERHDVLYGFSPRVFDLYVSYHSRQTYYTLIQRIEVSAAVAAQAKIEAENYGPVPKLFCANATSKILRRLPGFETIGQTMTPDRLLKDFGELPSVVTRQHREDDEDDKSFALIRMDEQLRLAVQSQQ
jgi:hypothetical protein